MNPAVLNKLDKLNKEIIKKISPEEETIESEMKDHEEVR